MRRLVALPLGLCATLALAQVHIKSDWELEMERRNWKEADIKLPAYPKQENLIEFYVSPTTEFRFFIDRQSLSVGNDGVVRYTLLARSPSGVENVTYEGIRCAARAYRVYAYGREAKWAERDSDWRDIEPKTMQRSHYALWREYLCPRKAPILDVAEGLEALRRGGLHNRGQFSPQ